MHEGTGTTYEGTDMAIDEAGSARISRAERDRYPALYRWRELNALKLAAERAAEQSASFYREIVEHFNEERAVLEEEAANELEENGPAAINHTVYRPYVDDDGCNRVDTSAMPVNRDAEGIDGLAPSTFTLDFRPGGGGPGKGRGAW